jgi:rhamnogalacturonyl hydrolase YesR
LISGVHGAGCSALRADGRDAATRVWVDSPNGKGVPPKWVYDYGVHLNGLKTLWHATGDRRYFETIKNGVDKFVNADGTIKTYTVEEYNSIRFEWARQS